jgi:hypothetical protein
MSRHSIERRVRTGCRPFVVGATRVTFARTSRGRAPADDRVEALLDGLSLEAVLEVTDLLQTRCELVLVPLERGDGRPQLRLDALRRRWRPDRDGTLTPWWIRSTIDKRRRRSAFLVDWR